MTLVQTAKLLEIIGFFTASCVAGIFLEKTILGTWANKNVVFFSWLVNKLNKINLPSGEISILSWLIKVPDKRSLDKLNIKTFCQLLVMSLLFIVVPVSILGWLFGYLLKVDWLFWSGLALLTSFFVISLIMFLLNLTKSKNHIDDKQPKNNIEIKEEQRETKRSKQAIKIAGITTTLVLSSPILLSLIFTFGCLFFVITLLMGFTRILQIIVGFLTRENVLRKWLIVLGVVMVLTGLIIEYIALLQC